jgi:hypothetical protein
MTSQSIGFSYRTEVMNELVSTDYGLVLGLHTIQEKQYAG